MTPTDWIIPLPDLPASERLGEALARMLRPSDVVAVSGPVGAGKTTLARAILRAFSGRPTLDVPSPTFTLVQPYDGEGFRFPVWHIDLYRITDAAEIGELGLDDALAQGAAALIEWPERGGSHLPAARIDVRLDERGGDRRATVSSADAGIACRIGRAESIRRFLAATPFATARRAFLQGDASPRAYERLTDAQGATAILVDADAQPDRPVTGARRQYMAATHLAPNEDIRPILAIGAELASRGFSVPQVIAADVTASLLLVEDLGRAYVADGGVAIPERYGAATDVLARMHALTWPDTARGPYGATHRLPRYSRTALETEALLCVERFLPVAAGRPVSSDTRDAFLAAWAEVFDIVDQAPHTWTIFDYHSPNLHWLPERVGIARIGIIDFQDARLGPAAYDLVSLLQDARVTVPPELEAELRDRYRARRRADGTQFDGEAFDALYAICGAQRATRILGVFARLAHDDGKPHYLRHMLRISGYLDRCLTHPLLRRVAQWYDAHAPGEVRAAFAAHSS
jgi:tRNA threonylcarbamoyl adenosine modification protein YjeE